MRVRISAGRFPPWYSHRLMRWMPAWRLLMFRHIAGSYRKGEDEMTDDDFDDDPIGKMLLIAAYMPTSDLMLNPDSDAFKLAVERAKLRAYRVMYLTRATAFLDEYECMGEDPDKFLAEHGFVVKTAEEQPAQEG